MQYRSQLYSRGTKIRIRIHPPLFNPLVFILSQIAGRQRLEAKKKKNQSNYKWAVKRKYNFLTGQVHQPPRLSSELDEKGSLTEARETALLSATLSACALTLTPFITANSLHLDQPPRSSSSSSSFLPLSLSLLLFLLFSFFFLFSTPCSIPTYRLA